MSRNYNSDEEWIIHSINIHGFFFERWCQEVVDQAEGWKLKYTNYPVEFPTPNGSVRGKESKLDIRADFDEQDRRLTLLIECKKNNPDFVNWVFFPKPKKPLDLRIASIDNISTIGSFWRVERFLQQASFDKIFDEGQQLLFADEAREARGSYKGNQNSDKTKTSNAAITEACQQVALATQAIIVEETNFSRLLGEYQPPQPKPYNKQIFLPTIVTTAKIFSCNFEAKDVDKSTGEIDLSKAKLTEHPYLVFEYALPRLLQHPPGNIALTLVSSGTLEAFARMPILVIHSTAFQDVLSRLAKTRLI